MNARFLLFSCAVIAALLFSPFRPHGSHARSVSPADSLPIEQPQYSGQWKGNDLSVQFSYSRDQGQMEISGEIQFSYSLVMGYSRLEDFQLGLVILDKNGNVIGQTGLTTSRGSFDPIPFRRRINLPSSAAYIAFTYQGTGYESGNEDGSGRTAFWYSPVR